MYFQGIALKFWMKGTVFQGYNRSRQHENHHSVPKHLHTALTSSYFLDDALIFLLPPRYRRYCKDVINSVFGMSLTQKYQKCVMEMLLDGSAVHVILSSVIILLLVECESLESQVYW